MDEQPKPGPVPDRVKIDVPWEEAAAKMIRTPPMPKGEKKTRSDVKRGEPR